MAPVSVESADIRTEVTGRIAVTTFDLVFRNPNGRVLEGTFEFPLLDGQTVVGFALDINGTMRQAVPVEKDRGRVVFEEIERRRVDPGLLEQTAGNNYRARIFPIPANGTRRVSITYQEDVVRGREATYRLALGFEKKLKKFHLTVSARTGQGEPPKVRTTLPLELPAWTEARVMEISRTDFQARGIVELSLPPAVRPQVITQQRGNAEYFYAEVPLGSIAAVQRKAPKIVGLLWDASGSGRNREHAREWALLEKWFAAVQDVEVRLILLRDQATAPRTFKVSRGNWSDLKRELDRVVYDGATSMDGLKDDSSVDEWLLVSDGLINYGADAARAMLPFKAPVHTIASGVQSNATMLRALAMWHAGEFVNLMASDPTEAATTLRSQSLRVIGIERNPEQVAEVFPERNAPVLSDTLIVTGRLNAGSATVRLRIGHNAADASTVELAVKSGENPSTVAARAWAAAKIAALEVDLAANREDIRRTSQDFGIVTADSSLIVLETVEDYVRYDIAPPEELRVAWAQRRQNAFDVRAKNVRSHIDRVVAQFAEKRTWWEKEYPKGKMDREYEKEKSSILRNPEGDEVVQLQAFSVASASERRREKRASGAERVQFEDRAERRIDGLARASVAAPALSYGGATPSARPDVEGTGAAISLQKWDPKAGYIARLRRAADDDAYGVYLEERTSHARQPGFFLDVAEFFLAERKDEGLGLRILSNLAELELEDARLLRVLGNRLMQAGRPELAKPLFERVLVMRPEEPQSRRDLALACAALKEYQRAVDLLWEVVSEPWNERFPGIELIALGELNAIVATCGQKLDLSKVDSRLKRNLPVRLRAVLTWDADACDIDLWVEDPNGEKAAYNNPRTYQGGWMSRDFTGGYGPEEFLLREPKAGRYVVKINYYGDSRVSNLGPVTAQVRLITGFGTKEQKEQRLTVRLTSKQESVEIGAIEIGSDS